MFQGQIFRMPIKKSKFSGEQINVEIAVIIKYYVSHLNKLHLDIKLNDCFVF